MRPVILFFLGGILAYYGWIGILENYAASSDISVRGAIFWMGGMCLPVVVPAGALFGLLCSLLVDWYLGRKRK